MAIDKASPRESQSCEWDGLKTMNAAPYVTQCLTLKIGSQGATPMCYGLKPRMSGEVLIVKHASHSERTAPHHAGNRAATLNADLFGGIPGGGY